MPQVIVAAHQIVWDDVPSTLLVVLIVKYLVYLATELTFHEYNVTLPRM